MLKSFIASILLLLVTACASSAAATDPAATTAAPPTSGAEQSTVESPVAVAQAEPTLEPGIMPTDENGQPLVARVNGEGIPYAQFERTLLRSQQQILAANPDALEDTVLDTMIEQVLIEQEAARQNVIVDDAAIEAEFQATKGMVASEEEWQQWLNENLYTEGEFRESLRETLIAVAMRDRVVSEIPENVLHIHARHILVDTEEEAHAVLQRLQNGEDFAALAASLSQDVTTREQGGDLGWFTEGELLEAALTQTAFSLADGEIGGPVPTRLGYHVIQTLERGEQPVTPEKRALLAQIQFENWIRGLSFNAIIERYLT